MWDASRPWLLPWIALLALVAAIPLLVWPGRSRRFLFSPVAFAAWFHILPSFVVGGLVLAAGFTPPFFPLIPVPEETLPWTLALVAVGFLSLYAGFALPWGGMLGARLSRVLPDPRWEAGRLGPVAAAAMVAAAAINVVAFRLGLVGFQVPAEPSAFAAAGAMLANVAVVTTTVLLMHVVIRPDAGRWRLPAAVLLLSWIAIDMLASGRRGALLQFVVLAAGVWLMSADRPRLTPRLAVTAAGLGSAAVLAGMIYGTTFRFVLGASPATTTAQYAEAGVEAFRIVADRGVVPNLTFALGHLAERLEIVSSVAIVIGNYDRLRPFEHAFGLADNIRTSLLSALVPRVVWPDKPSVSDPRAMGELYFGYRNSYAITPAADLVRNFGPWGVPAGMAVLGLLLRVGYAALVELQPPSIARSTAYIVLMTTVSYEGFYGSIVPMLLRTGAVLVPWLAIVHVLMLAQRDRARS